MNINKIVIGQDIDVLVLLDITKIEKLENAKKFNLQLLKQEKNVQKTNTIMEQNANVYLTIIEILMDNV